MAKLDNGVALTLVSVAGFQLLTAWNNNAPSLADIRQSHSHDPVIRQQLYDADFLVGGIAVVLGLAVIVTTHDTTAAAVLIVIFGLVSLWHHSVLNAQPL